MGVVQEAEKWRGVTFDKPKRERLRKAYRAAIRKKQDKFTFDGNEYLACYAKYLLEYLDMKIK
ncbi:MAG TPA: hypothetical protein VIY48_16075 [Candidatus Paceibacterota bacterium]